MRNLEAVQAGMLGLQICRASPDDVDVAVGLSRGLARHLASAPVFVTEAGTRDRRHEVWLANPSNALRLAFGGKEALGGLA